MFRTATLYVESLAGGYTLWLGLYIFTRGLPLTKERSDGKPAWWRHIPTLGATSIILAAWFIFGVAYRSVITDRDQYVLWFRLTWWAIPVATSTWLYTVLLMTEEPRPASITPRLLTAAILVLALPLALVGTFSELVFVFSETRPLNAGFDLFYIPPHLPEHVLYVLVLLAVFWWPVLRLAAHYRRLAARSAARHEFRYLLVGNGVFTLGATASVIAYAILEGRLPEQLGNVIATLGLGIIGLGVTRYNSLVRQRVISQDFGRSLRGIALAVLAFLGTIHLVFDLANEPVPPILIPTMIYLVVLAGTPLRWLSWLMDYLTLPHWQARFMRRITQVRQEVMVSPNQQEALQMAQSQLVEITHDARVGQSRVMIEKEIDQIFRHKTFQKNEVMANSRLLNLKLLQAQAETLPGQRPLVLYSEAEKAGLLRLFLETFIKQQICPEPDAAIPTDPSDQWLEYLILSKSYLEGKTRRQVILEVEKESGLRIAGDGSTGGRVYNRHLQNSRRRLAELLWLREQELQQHQ